VGPSTTRQDERPTLAEADIDKHLVARAFETSRRRDVLTFGYHD
jgi:hypothetical protein